MNKVIKTVSDYKSALADLEGLMELDPPKGTPEGDRLELLSVLIEHYEKKRTKRSFPDPIGAIKFRMEQQDLSPRDLVPMIGSRSKVSEVLARKRPLTLAMLRALHSTLGIPASVLLSDEDPKHLTEQVEWDKFPLKEMLARGWISGKLTELKANAENTVRRFFIDCGLEVPVVMACRKTNHLRSARQMNTHALLAWAARVSSVGRQMQADPRNLPKKTDIEFLRKVARLSWSDKGPLLAREYLHKYGIPLVVEPHFSQTHLDGACLFDERNYPIIGLTLRYDRIDNFWFTLLHELAHMVLHSSADIRCFFDDLEVDSADDKVEEQADALAGEALIPTEVWVKSPASRLKSPDAAQLLARQLCIHPTIVAGRMRHEFKAYKMLNSVVGHRQVRKLFPDHSWS